jgi:choline dehydrogenase-like flavoprotein
MGLVQIDARRLPPESQLEADVVVVGAGCAGIVLALELADADLHVLLIESGGETFDAEAQRLGDTVGDDPAHAPMSVAARRQIGGASNIWGGRCVPYDPLDFQPRAIVPDSGWPVGYDELQGYFAGACEWCRCGEPIFDARELPGLASRSLVPGWPAGEVSATALERWSLPTNFRREYHSRLRSSPLITLATGLTCTEIVCDPSGARVAQLVGRTLDGNRVTVCAKRNVLACGGLESTRLLFASNRVHPEGIGNHSGHLGRWYMAHIEARIARIHFSTDPRETIYAHERDSDGVYVRRRFTFAPEFLAEHDLPNLAMWLENPEIADPGHGSGVLSFVYLTLASPLGRYLISEGIRQHQIDSTRGRISKRSHLANVIRDIGPTAAFALTFGYRRFVKPGRKAPGFFVPSSANVYALLYQGEHLPHYASHVEPSSERDALGLPRLRTRLHIGEVDVQNAIRAHEHFDRYLRRHDLGHLEYIHDDPATAIRERLFCGCHQVGTTRMSAHPEDGVLDPDLAVHGFGDLYVASSSAFVTSSQANSTFMIVVFALRLAEHLRRTLTPQREALSSAGGSLASPGFG